MAIDIRCSYESPMGACTNAGVAVRDGRWFCEAHYVLTLPPPLALPRHPLDQPPPRDPWAHRAETLRCKTCLFYVSKGIELPDQPPPPLGRCRRHAPTLAGWPAVYPADWCGDHKLDGDRL